MEERLNHMMRLLLREAPDFIGLQEVTQRVQDALRSSAALLQLYDISPFDVGHYGCLVLARRDFQAAFKQVELPTEMGRSLILADATARLDVTFATVHLESLDSASTRAAQLEEAARQLAPCRHAVLCGDFNFDSQQAWGDWRRSRRRRTPPERLEESALPSRLPGFVDAWPAVHPGERGITFDGEHNPYVHDRGECMRYDRIMVHRLRPVGASLLGSLSSANEPDSTQAYTAGATPSDHYGVVADLARD